MNIIFSSEISCSEAGSTRPEEGLCNKEEVGKSAIEKNRLLSNHRNQTKTQRRQTFAMNKSIVIVRMCFKFIEYRLNQ